jgi:hypothetical protein
MAGFQVITEGPLAYDDYGKCKNCSREYTDQIEIHKLVAIKRALLKKSLRQQ